MIQSIFPRASEPTPLRTALLGLAPFLAAGPAMVVVSYHPGWDPVQAPWVFPLAIGALVVLICAGFWFGVRQRFPLWSYPYAVYLLILLIFGVTYLVNGTPWDINDEGGIALAVLGLAVLAMVIIPVLRPFYANLRRDWTQLSYGLFVFTMFMLSGQDHDISPHLTPLVLLPGLIALAGAALYLCLGSTIWRLVALLASLLLGGLVWVAPILIEAPGDRYQWMLGTQLLLTAWGILGLLLIAPALIGIFARPRLAA
jgi:hypothetical protein